MCSFIPHWSSSPKGLTIFYTKFRATPFYAQMTSKLLNMGLVACLRGHRASDALSLLRRAERGGPQLQLDFFRTRGTGGTWHSDVGFFHTAVGGFCVDSWGLWSTASAEGIRNSLGYSVLLSFFHRRGKILNN